MFSFLSSSRKFRGRFRVTYFSTSSFPRSISLHRFSFRTKPSSPFHILTFSKHPNPVLYFPKYKLRTRRPEIEYQLIFCFTQNFVSFLYEFRHIFFFGPPSPLSLNLPSPRPLSLWPIFQEGHHLNPLLFSECNAFPFSVTIRTSKVALFFYLPPQ